MKRWGITPFTGWLVSAIVLASIIPVRGEPAAALSSIGAIAVALLFFLHGAALSGKEVIAGASHWKLHLLIVSMTFILFPVMVVPISLLAPAFMPADLALGFLYLGVLPSAVSSSIAFTAMARGNVPAAVCSAAASNVFGMMLTPFLLVYLVSASGTGDFAVAEALKEIVFQLLLPFAVGQALRPWLGGFMARHVNLSARYDQAVILLIVYSAFSESVVSGLWQNLPLSAVALTILLCVVLLFLGIVIAAVAGRIMGLSIADEAAAVFCGSKKSLASGLPMAKVLFAGHPGFGMIVLPIMCYNQIQIIVGALLAQRYRRRIDASESGRIDESL
jgi:sodium/bile acid cotransporter 7